MTRRNLFSSIGAAIGAAFAAVRPARAAVEVKHAYCSPDSWHADSPAWRDIGSHPANCAFYRNDGGLLAVSDAAGRLVWADEPRNMALVTVYSSHGNGYLVGAFDGAGFYHEFGPNGGTRDYVNRVFDGEISIADDGRELMHWLTFRDGCLKRVDLTPRYPLMPDGWKMPDRGYTDPSW